MVKLIIFDFDGVIVDGTNQGYFTCYHKALEAVGVKLDPKEERRRILARWSQPSAKELEGLLIEHPEKLPAAIEAYDACYRSPIFEENIQLIDGCKKSLEGLSKQYVMAIASGMRRETMDALIKKFDIDYFTHIVTNEDVQKDEDMKPAPFMVEKILKESGVKKEEAVFVGDAASDVVMARNAGVRPIAVLTGHLTKKEAQKLRVMDILPDITSLASSLR